jgi:TNF receptor-associated factor 4
MSSDGPGGGYDYSFVDNEKSSEYTCPICALVLRDPVQTSCGHLFCSSCLAKLKNRNRNGFTCPTCRTNLTKNNYFLDERVSRHIKSLQVYCKNKHNGCQWTGNLNNIENHVKWCSKESMILCEFSDVGCNERIKRREQDEHNEKYIKQHLQLLRLAQVKANDNNYTKFWIFVCILAIIIASLYNNCYEKFKDDLLLHKTYMHKKLDEIQSENDILMKGSPRIFKLDEFTAKKRSNSVWCSRGFYSSPGGFKLRLCVYANGIGDGKHTHVSLFIHFINGKYDDILEWSDDEVTVELLNQLENKNHFKTVLRDPHDWDRPQFISHSRLGFKSSLNRQYLKDDTLYFRVSAKVNSKTKPWLVG